MLAVGASTVAAGLGGCLDRIPFIGDEPIEFGASRATIPDSVLEETDYDEQSVDEHVIEEEVEAAGRTQQVVVTNWLAEYDKAVDLGELGIPTDQEQRAAICTVISSPQVNVLGRTFNPIGQMSAADLAEMVQDRYDGMDNLEQVGEADRTVAGETTTVAEFQGEADLTGSGQSVEVTIHIAEAVEAGEDLVLAIGGYPTELQDQEAEHTFSMFAGIEHQG